MVKLSLFALALAFAACQSHSDEQTPPPKKDARVVVESPPIDASDEPVREPEPPDPGKVLADLGAVSAWQAVIDRAQCLARRGQHGVVYGTVGTPIMVLGPAPPPPPDDAGGNASAIRARLVAVEYGSPGAGS